MPEVKQKGPGRPKDDRTANVYIWVKPINKAFLMKLAKQNKVALSPYMDLIIDQMRKKYGQEK